MLYNCAPVTHSMATVVRRSGGQPVPLWPALGLHHGCGIAGAAAVTSLVAGGRKPPLSAARPDAASRSNGNA